MNFLIIDISFLILFIIFTTTFLYRKRNNIKKQGWLFLYDTKWGIKLIEKIGKKYSKTLKVASYFSVVIGYLLMVGMIYLFVKIVIIYLFNADLVRAVKMPPIMPLIPYTVSIFNLNNLFPSEIYFSYWIIIIAIVAVSHEFFHGIFARLNKIKVKKTGFGFFPFFLPVFPLAYVELDEKAMEKISSFKQRAILSAGTFANILTAILGILIMAGFFSLSYAPTGLVFDDYASKIVSTSEITAINGIQLMNPNYEQILNLTTQNEQNYFTVGGENNSRFRGASPDGELLSFYYNAPAIEAELYGPITKLNDVKINSLEKFSKELDKHSIGEEVILTTEIEGEEKNFNLILELKPGTENEVWIGISFYDQDSSGVVGKITQLSTFYKRDHIYYSPLYGFAPFIYGLFWWLIMISFSVALVNMLPAGIFDGGRFFYLTVLSLTKSEKMAKKSYKAITNIFLFLLLLIMVFWVKSFF